MTPADFTLDAVPLRGPLAPIAALLGDGDGVLLDIGEDTGWWGRVRARPDKAQRDGALWIESWCWCHAEISRLDSVDLVTSPAAASPTILIIPAAARDTWGMAAGIAIGGGLTLLARRLGWSLPVTDPETGVTLSRRQLRVLIRRSERAGARKAGFTVLRGPDQPDRDDD